MFDNGSLLRRRKRFKSIRLAKKRNQNPNDQEVNNEQDNADDIEDEHEEDDNEDLSDTDHEDMSNEHELPHDESNTHSNRALMCSEQEKIISQMIYMSSSLKKSADFLGTNSLRDYSINNSGSSLSPSSSSLSTSSSFAPFNSTKKTSSFSIENLIGENSKSILNQLNNQSVAIKKMKSKKKLSQNKANLILNDNITMALSTKSNLIVNNSVNMNITNNEESTQTKNSNSSPATSQNSSLAFSTSPEQSSKSSKNSSRCESPGESNNHRNKQLKTHHSLSQTPSINQLQTLQMQAPIQMNTNLNQYMNMINLLNSYQTESAARFRNSLGLLATAAQNGTNSVTNPFNGLTIENAPFTRIPIQSNPQMLPIIANEAQFNMSNQHHLIKMLNDAMVMRAASAQQQQQQLNMFNQSNAQANQTNANSMANINLSNILPLFMPMHS